MGGGAQPPGEEVYQDASSGDGTPIRQRPQINKVSFIGCLYPRSLNYIDNIHFILFRLSKPCESCFGFGVDAGSRVWVRRKRR